MKDAARPVKNHPIELLYDVTLVGGKRTSASVQPCSQVLLAEIAPEKGVAT
jgi:hypothetical protein